MALLQKIALVALASVGVAGGQLEYLDGPVENWATIVPPLDEGNAAQISPDGEVLYVTSFDGAITGIDPASGFSLFSYKPPEEGATVTSTSGVSFYMGSEESAVYYAVSDGANGVSENPMSRVVALSHPTGNVLWISPSIEGEAAGTPQVSSDGRHVFVITNSNSNSVGHFTILETIQNGTVLHTEFNETNPFSPPGIIRSPAEGYYKGGENNQRDVVAWAFARNPADLGVGEGGTFLFQFPRFYLKGDPIAVRYLRQVGWQSFAAPLITNFGRSMYFAVTRNQFRGWVGGEDAVGAKFHNGATSSLNLARGNPTYLAPFNTPATNTDNSVLFCGLANNSMAAMSPDLDVLWLVDTASSTNVMSEAVVSMDDEVVFWSESAGFMQASGASSGGLMWRVELTGEMNSEFSLSLDGSTLFFGDKGGRVVSWKIADPPTPSPSNAPTDAPSLTPSESPTMVPTRTASPSTPLPTSFPSVAPSPAPTAKPDTAKPTVGTNSGVRLGPNSGASAPLRRVSILLTSLALATLILN